MMRKLLTLLVFGLLPYLGTALPMADFTAKSKTILKENTIAKDNKKAVVLTLGAIKDVFPDPALAEAMRLALIQRGYTKPTVDESVTQVELDRITELRAEGKNIQNMEGLQLCSALYFIDLRNNQISNLTPLTNLPVRHLFLDNNKITNVSALSLHTGMVRLGLDDNKITDASVVSNFPVLRDVSFSGNLIKILPHFTSSELLEIYFDKNQISDYSPVNLWNTTNVTILSMKDQVIRLPNQYSVSGTISVNNPLKDIDGTVLNTIMTISNGGIYTTPTISWVNLPTSTIQTTFLFSKNMSKGVFSGTVIQPFGTVGDETICLGETVTLNASSTVVNPTYTWYSDPALTAQIAVGASYTVSPTVTTTYYVSVYGDGVCENESGTAKAIKVTVNPKATASDITAADATICIGETTTLSATSTVVNPIFKWYSDSNLTTELFTGASYDVTPTVTTTYYVTVEGDGICANAAGTAKEVTVTVNPSIEVPIFTLGSTSIICQASIPIIYTATSMDSTGITYSLSPVTAGTIDSATGEVTWNATFVGTAEITAEAVGCSGPKTAIHTVTVTPSIETPVFVLGSSSTICQASAAITYTATATNSTGITYSLSPVTAGTIDSATGEVTWNVTFVGTAEITAEAIGCSGPKTAIHTVTITPSIETPIFRLGSSSIICQGSVPVIYLATSTNSTGISFSISPTTAGTIDTTTGEVTWNATFVGIAEITAEAIGCSGPKTAIHTVTVNPKATASDITIADAAICEGETTTLSATSTIVNPIFTWYSDAALMTEIGTGATHSVSPTVTTTYYVTISGDATCANGVGTAKEVTVTVNPKATVTDLTVEDDIRVCHNEGFHLQAFSSVTNPVFTWYSDANLTNVLSVGEVFTSPFPAIATTYYVTVQGDGICENAPGTAKMITVTIKSGATASDITASDATICIGETTTLSATSTVANPIFTWYSDAALTTEIATGASYDVTPTVTTTYYVTVSGYSVSGEIVCENGPGTAKEVTVTVNPNIEVPIFTLGSTSTICQASAAITYTATATNSTGITYSLSPVTAGTIDSATGEVTWNATFVGTAEITAEAVGCSGPKTAIHTVTVTPSIETPVFVLGSSSTICQASAAITYTVTATNSTGITYSLSPVTAGTIDSATGEVTWNVTFVGTAEITAEAVGCSGPKTAIHTVTITPSIETPVFRLGLSSIICQGSVPVIYLATSTNSTGISFSISPTTAGTIDTTTGEVTWNATFVGIAEITAEAIGCSGPKTAIHTVTVNPKATASDITVVDAAICEGETTTLSATSTIVNPVFTWYSDAALTTEIGTGSTHSVSPTVTTTYYVIVSGDATCTNAVGTAKEVTVTVNPKATASDITVVDATICVGETTTLSATSTIVNPVFTWYSDAALTTEIGTGATHLVSPTVTTMYYVTVSGDATCANAVGTAKEVTVTVNPKATASDITVADQAICSGSTAILSATSTIVNPVFTWYSDAALTTEIGTGSTHLVSPTVTTTYYVTVSGDATCANAVGTAKEVTVTVNPKATASDITVADAVICEGETTTLLATSTIVNPVFTWYSDAALTTEIGTGATHSVSPTVTTTYYVTVSGDATCTNAVGTAKEVTVTVNPKATASDITVVDATICVGETTTLSATSTIANPVFTWYSDAALMTEIGTGSTHLVSPTVTTTYYVTVSGDATCANAVGTAKEVTVTVNPKATASDITVADAAICEGETTTLLATSTIVNPVFTWYSDAALTTEIGTGSTHLVSPTVTTMYYVTVSGDATCANAVGTAKEVTVTVNPKATASDITVADAAICEGETTTLSATSTIVNPIFTWYSDAALTTEIGTGSTHSVSPTVTTTYYVTVSGDATCANAVGTAKEVTVTVNPKATASDITIADQAICSGSTAILSATSTIVNPVFTWYSDAALTTEIGTGSTHLVSPTVTTTYYITVSGDTTCANAVGTAKEVTVTVNPKATASDITVADAAICEGETTTLSATSTIVNPIFTWYSDAALTTEIGTGSTHSVSPTVTTTYYVTVSGDATCANAVGTAKEVTVTVNPKATASDITIADQAICSGSTAILSATSTIVNPVFTWYSDAALTTEIGTGSTHSVSPTVTTTYYVTVSGDATCTNAVGTAKEVTVTVGNLGTPTTNEIVQEFCLDTNPTVDNIQVNETNVIWYDAITGGNSITPGTPLINGQVYYATLHDGEVGCESAVRLAITVHIKMDVPGEKIAWNAMPCVFEEVTYTTTVGMTDYDWMITGGTIVAGGQITDNYVTILWSTVGNGTIDLSFMNVNNCDPLVSVDFTVNVNACSDLSIDKVVDVLQPEIGENVKFTITVKNSGTAKFENIIVSDLLPTGYLFVNATTSIGNYVSATGVWTIPELQGGEETTMVVTATVLQSGNYLNIAAITGSNPQDSNPDNNQAEAKVEPIDLVIYNGVSPNGDGLNDFFHIQGIEKYPDNTVEIYNRWGVKVFGTKGYGLNNKVFRGVSEGRATLSKGDNVTSGTYFYIIRYVSKGGEHIEKSGYLYVN